MAKKGPIAPINEIRSVLNYAVKVVPRPKLMLDIPKYAYDWTITGEKRTGISYSTQGAIDRYISHESKIFYDDTAPLPGLEMLIKTKSYMRYGLKIPAVFLRFHLVKEYRLGGLGCWHLGTSMPQTEEILLTEFNVQ